jgi:alpha-glucosidase (family GH31 glycosyl hydrolase)
MIPYYYTEMSMISKEEGGAFYRPLFFDFPTDAQAYKNLTHNVMLGPGLKASFQSTENETVLKTEYYFPDGTWCGIFWKLDGECIEGPKNETLSSNIFEGHAHIRNGYILPLQTQVVGKDRNVTKVDELMKDPIELHINVDFNDEAKCVATGRFLSDDGLVLNITER